VGVDGFAFDAGGFILDEDLGVGDGGAGLIGDLADDGAATAYRDAIKSGDCESDTIWKPTMRWLNLFFFSVLGLWGADPRAISLHPFVGQRGTTFTATVRGNNLSETRAVAVDEPGLRVVVEGLGKETGPARDTVKIRIETTEETKAGRYSFRLVTKNGVSNSLVLGITDAAVLAEPEGTHETAETAVAVAATPAVYAGLIGRKGETDLYSFSAAEGETLTFQVRSGLPSLGAPGGNANGFDPAISIFEESGSWFDAKRLNRVAFNDEPLWVLGRLTDAHLVHTFGKAGRYFLRLEAFSGQGGPDYGYQLQISPGSVGQERESAKTDWEERVYQRPLTANRLNELAARGGRAEKEKVIETYRAGGTVGFPATIEGTIGRPGEMHRAKFRVDGPQDLAIEIETPDGAPPLFNPVVRLLDWAGAEVVTNVFAGRGACTGAMNKGLTAKVIYPLRNPGEYTVEVRDLTADLGEASFRYRVQVRPQVGHVGKIVINEDHLNLAPGGAKTVRVTFDREEDFRGALAVMVENLPEGVVALAAADYEPDTDPPPFLGKRERYVPRTERTVIAFSVAEGAALTEVPKLVRVTVRPVVDGRPGKVIASKQIPMMVVVKP